MKICIVIVQMVKLIEFEMGGCMESLPCCHSGKYTFEDGTVIWCTSTGDMIRDILDHMKMSTSHFNYMINPTTGRWPPFYLPNDVNKFLNDLYYDLKTYDFWDRRLTAELPPRRSRKV